MLDLVGVQHVRANQYESISNPSRMGSMLNVAYGGCALANGISAAYASMPSPKKYHLYSTLGNYLGPALNDRKVLCYVFPYRNTRTFYTCRVELKQRTDKGDERSIMMLLADFQVAEPALMRYSAPPVRKYSSVDQTPTQTENQQRNVDKGDITEKQRDTMRIVFGLMDRFFDARPCPESLWSQNLAGIAKHIKTSQDHLPLTNKTSSDWLRVRDDTLTEPATHYAAMGFIMDAALAFIPLTHDHGFLDDSSACSSLEFACRFFVTGEEIDMRKWHLREMKTINGAHGRTYSESQLWTQTGDMVCSMTQQSIMRPLKPKEKL